MNLEELNEGYHRAGFQLGRDSADNPRVMRIVAIDGLDDQGYLVVRLLGQDPSGNPVNIATDAEGRLLSSGSMTAHVDDVEALLKDIYFPYVQYDWDVDDNPIYVGYNTDLVANDGDTDWIIFKFDYSGSNVVKKRMRVTSWTNRAIGW